VVSAVIELVLKSLAPERQRSRWKYLRFLLVGGLNTLFSYLVFSGLIWLGWRDVYALPVATVAGISFNFLTYGKLVFESLDRRNLPRFVLGYLGLYVCNVLGLRALARVGLDAYAAQALLTVPLALVSYIVNDRWVFRAR
jgi:putative flippase GtrA